MRATDDMIRESSYTTIVKKSLLLINPWIYDFAAYDFWAKPLGLLYIASILRENGFDVHFIDCLNVDHKTMKKSGRLPVRRSHGTGKFYKQRIDKPDPLKKISRNYSRYGISLEVFEEDLMKISAPDVVLVTSLMTYWYPGVLEAIRVVRDVYPKTPVLLGGIYATLCDKHAKAYSGADFVIRGQGENRVLDLVGELTGSVVRCYPDAENLDSYPYPAFDLLGGLKYVCILTSRGCPFACSYCASRILYPAFRQRSPLRVVDEIEYWVERFGVGDFAFYDDALLINAKSHIIPLLTEVIARGIEVNFHTPNGLHVREITEDVAHLLYKAGFRTVRLGLETYNLRFHEVMDRKLGEGDFARAIENLKEAGFRGRDIGVYLLVGLPGQPKEEIEKSIGYVKDFGITPRLAEYSPIPSTDLWPEAIRASRFNLETEPLFHNNSIFPCQPEEFLTETIPYLKNLAKTSE